VSTPKIDFEAIDAAIEYFEKRQDYCAETGRNEEMRLCIELGWFRAAVARLIAPNEPAQHQRQSLNAASGGESLLHSWRNGKATAPRSDFMRQMDAARSDKENSDGS